MWQKLLGGRASPGPTGGAQSAPPRLPNWISGGRFAAGEGRKGREEKGRLL